MNSNTRLRTAFALALAVPAFVAGCGGDDDGGGGSDEDPAVVLKSALTNDSEVNSGVINLSLSGNIEGDQGGDAEISLSGPFQGGGGTPVALDLDITGNVNAAALEAVTGSDSLDFEGGVTLADETLFVNYNGTEYVADDSLNSQIAPFLETAADAPGTAGGSTPEEADQFIESLEGLSNEGSEDIDGDSTTHVSASLDIAGLIEAGAAAQATPVPFDPSQLEGLESTVDFFVGDDDIVRQVDFNFSFDVPEELQGQAGAEAIDAQISAGVSGLNEEQTIEAPTDPEPLDGLLEQLGIDPSALGGLGALGALGGAGSLEGLGGAGGGGSGGSGDAELDALSQCIAEADPAEVDACFE